MLTVITPATETALTTVARATAMLALAAGDADALAIAIPQASQIVVDHCRRPFAEETVTETFRFAGCGVLIGRSPVTTITAVTDGETPLSTLEYEYEAATGVLYRLAGVHRTPWYSNAVAVTYTAGFTLPADTGSFTLPPAVERAAILLIGAMLAARDRDPLMRSEEIPGVRTVSWWVPDGKGLASSEAELLLEPYRRIVG